MRFAIISDLHVGTASHAADFSIGDGATTVIPSYINYFKQAFDHDEFKCDALLIPGDITNRARADEFKLAADRIKDIARILKVPEEKIFFTPGNHDSNWPQGEVLEEQGEIDSQAILNGRYNFLNSNPFFKARIEKSKFGRFELSPYFVLWITNDIVVLSFNSAAQDSHKEKVHHGIITSDLVKQVKLQLEEHLPEIKNKPKILLVHHHPINYEDKTFEGVDHSIMANACVLTDFAGEVGFDFIIHGHKHVARYNHMIGAAGYPINILCAGSFSASLSNLYFGGVGNSFHIIEIDKHCDETEIPQGRILSWSHFVKNGWIKNTAGREELTHSESFGTNLNRIALKKKLQILMSEKFIQAELITWNELIEYDVSYMYCSTTTTDIILKELSIELEFQIFSDPELVFFKRRTQNEE